MNRPPVLPQRLLKVRETLREAVEGGLVPSVAVAVVRAGEILWEEGFGVADRSRNLPASAHTMYSVASISKPITATGLMVLVDRGMLRLDDVANEYLGDTKLTLPGGKVEPVTLRQIANHTSGLPLHYQFFYENEGRPVPDREESIRRYGVLVTPPGACYQYANFGYGVLDHMIARISEQSYAQFMKEEVFEPLGMSRSSIHARAGDGQGDVAVRYGSDGDPIAYYGFDHDGASAVYSSAHDLARFALFHLKTPRKDQRVLFGESLLDAMQVSTATINAQLGYGVGWRMEENRHGYRLVGHTGGMPGVRTRLTLVPDEQIAVVALTNVSCEFPFRVVEEVLSALLPGYERGRSETLSSDTEKASESSPCLETSLTGVWVGLLSTPEGDRKVSLWIHPEGEIQAQVESQEKSRVNEVEWENGFLRGWFRGDIRTEDTARIPYHLHLRLRQEGERLSGNLSAISRIRSDETDELLPKIRHFALSHPLCLDRRVSVEVDSFA